MHPEVNGRKTIHMIFGPLHGVILDLHGPRTPRTLWLKLALTPQAMRAGKRKRRGKKVDVSKVDFKVAKKRGRSVVTAEKRQQRSKVEMEEEIKKWKEAKKEATKSKARRRKQPEPIQKRKELDYFPVEAGMRKDYEARMAHREKTRVAREERRARRQAAREKKERLGKEEVSLQDVLGGDFFGGDGIAPDLEWCAESRVLQAWTLDGKCWEFASTFHVYSR